MAELEVPALESLRERQSAKWRTYPDDVLPLTVAEMDFVLAPPIAAALHEAIDRSDAGYAIPVPRLGRAFAAFAGRRWDWQVDAIAVTAVTDVGVGVVELLRLLAGPSSTVLISPPVYPPFFDWVAEAGARLAEVPLAWSESLGWRLDLAALERAFAELRPAAYILCNPANPVGRVHTADELRQLVELARRYQVTIVSDEIHAPVVLPGARFTPLLNVPGAAELAVSVTSASKAWNLAGLKCAVIVTASKTMTAVVDRLPPDAQWRIGHLGVIATIAAFTEAESWLDDLLDTLDQRRRLLATLLADRLPLVRWQPPAATYLAWLDCSALGMDAHRRFLEDGRVAFEPGLRFGAIGAGHVRLNFGTSAAILEQAVDRMVSAIPAS